MKRLFTGLQPSGDAIHIGNYFGALKPFLGLYEGYESLLCVVDYHALTTIRDPEVLRKNTIHVAKAYLAVGVDPSKAIIFRQSAVAAHTELAWIFECLVTVPFLMQSHAYKDKTAKGLEATAGLFNYPMLMASDILLYDTDIVPVGKDQEQHLEYARDVAGKFNRSYSKIFKEPETHIQKEVAVVPGIDGEKMSKSYKNTIPLFAPEDEVRDAIMKIMTDSDATIPQNVHAIHSLFKNSSELDSLYSENKGNYKFLKDALANDLLEYFSDARKSYNTLSDSKVETILKEGEERANSIAEAKMREVRKAIGVR